MSIQESAVYHRRKAALETLKRNGPRLEIAAGIRTLQAAIHAQNVSVGWYDQPREVGTLLMLIVSEVAEAMEGERKDLMDTHLPNRKMAEVELADAVIRILDYAELCGYDLAGALMEKFEYNRTRADHQRENRNAEGGKKF